MKVYLFTSTIKARIRDEIADSASSLDPDEALHHEPPYLYLLVHCLDASF